MSHQEGFGVPRLSLCRCAGGDALRCVTLARRVARGSEGITVAVRGWRLEVGGLGEKRKKRK